MDQWSFDPDDLAQADLQLERVRDSVSASLKDRYTPEDQSYILAAQNARADLVKKALQVDAPKLVFKPGDTLSLDQRARYLAENDPAALDLLDIPKPPKKAAPKIDRVDPGTVLGISDMMITGIADKVVTTIADKVVTDVRDAPVTIIEDDVVGEKAERSEKVRTSIARALKAPGRPFGFVDQLSMVSLLELWKDRPVAEVEAAIADLAKKDPFSRAAMAAPPNRMRSIQEAKRIINSEWGLDLTYAGHDFALPSTGKTPTLNPAQARLVEVLTAIATRTALSGRASQGGFEMRTPFGIDLGSSLKEEMHPVKASLTSFNWGLGMHGVGPTLFDRAAQAINPSSDETWLSNQLDFVSSFLGPSVKDELGLHRTPWKTSVAPLRTMLAIRNKLAGTPETRVAITTDGQPSLIGVMPDSDPLFDRFYFTPNWTKVRNKALLDFLDRSYPTSMDRSVPRSGRLFDPYDNAMRVFKDEARVSKSGSLVSLSPIEIDHIVALNYAWEHGFRELFLSALGDPERMDKVLRFAGDFGEGRGAFSNYLNLAATAADVNRLKSNKGPDLWTPHPWASTPDQHAANLFYATRFRRVTAELRAERIRMGLGIDPNFFHISIQEQRALARIDRGWDVGTGDLSDRLVRAGQDFYLETLANPDLSDNPFYLQARYGAGLSYAGLAAKSLTWRFEPYNLAYLAVRRYLTPVVNRILRGTGSWGSGLTELRSRGVSSATARNMMYEARRQGTISTIYDYSSSNPNGTNTILFRSRNRITAPTFFDAWRYAYGSSDPFRTARGSTHAPAFRVMNTEQFFDFRERSIPDILFNQSKHLDLPDWFSYPSKFGQDVVAQRARFSIYRPYIDAMSRDLGISRVEAFERISSKQLLSDVGDASQAIFMREQRKLASFWMDDIDRMVNSGYSMDEAFRRVIPRDIASQISKSALEKYRRTLSIDLDVVPGRAPLSGSSLLCDVYDAFLDKLHGRGTYKDVGRKIASSVILDASIKPLDYGYRGWASGAGVWNGISNNIDNLPSIWAIEGMMTAIGKTVGIEAYVSPGVAPVTLLGHRPLAIFSALSPRRSKSVLELLPVRHFRRRLLAGASVSLRSLQPLGGLDALDRVRESMRARPAMHASRAELLRRQAAELDPAYARSRLEYLSQEFSSRARGVSFGQGGYDRDWNVMEQDFLTERLREHDRLLAQAKAEERASAKAARAFKATFNPIDLPPILRDGLEAKGLRRLLIDLQVSNPHATMFAGRVAHAPVSIAKGTAKVTKAFTYDALLGLTVRRNTLTGGKRLLSRTLRYGGHGLSAFGGWESMNRFDEAMELLNNDDWAGQARESRVDLLRYSTWTRSDMILDAGLSIATLDPVGSAVAGYNVLAKGRVAQRLAQDPNYRVDQSRQILSGGPTLLDVETRDARVRQLMDLGIMVADGDPVTTSPLRVRFRETDAAAQAAITRLQAIYDAKVAAAQKPMSAKKALDKVVDAYHTLRQFAWGDDTRAAVDSIYKAQSIYNGPSGMPAYSSSPYRAWEDPVRAASTRDFLRIRELLRPQAPRPDAPGMALSTPYGQRALELYGITGRAGVTGRALDNAKLLLPLETERTSFFTRLQNRRVGRLMADELMAERSRTIMADTTRSLALRQTSFDSLVHARRGTAPIRASGTVVDYLAAPAKELVDRASNLPLFSPLSAWERHEIAVDTVQTGTRRWINKRFRK